MRVVTWSEDNVGDATETFDAAPLHDCQVRCAHGDTHVVGALRLASRPGHVLFTPFANTKMLENSGINDAIVTFGCAAAENRARKMPSGKYASLKKEIWSWFEQADADDADTTLPEPTLPPLEDQASVPAAS